MVQSLSSRPARARSRSGAARSPLRALVVAVVALSALVALTVPAGALPTGVDVASHQHVGSAPIDWRAVRAAGHTFAFVKATEGTSYTNPWFAADWRDAGSAGLYRGAYHFARPALPVDSAVTQARYFVSRTGSMTGGLDLPGVLDLEMTGGLTTSELAQWTRNFLGEVQRLTGKSPILYTGYYFWRDSVGAPADIARNYRLWLPSYPNDPESTTFKPLVPAGWATWTFWQYRSDGSVPGIVGDVDVNRFCCDDGSLAAMAGSGNGGGGPFGSLDAAGGGVRSVSVGGWAIDPDTTESVAVAVRAGSVVTTISADKPRADVATVFAGFGDGHGYSASVPAEPGRQQVCAYGINVGGGTDRLLGCKVVDVLPDSPIGHLDVARPVYGGVDVAGWTIDPDTTAPGQVHVYVDGKGYALPSGSPRPDVAGAYPGYGEAHGFGSRVPATAGTHQVCAYGINVAGGGVNTLLGCRTVTVPGGSPVGYLDVAVSAFGVVRVAGWAFDPDNPASTDVHVYVNGVGRATTTDIARPDVQAAYPGTGPRSGFDLIVPRQGTGAQDVCVYGINTAGGGANVLLGCRRL